MPINVDEEYDGLIRRVTDAPPPRLFVATDDEIGRHPLLDEDGQALPLRTNRWPDHRKLFAEEDPLPGIRLGLPTLKMPIRVVPINIGYFWNNFSLGILPYGVGVVTDFAFSLGIPEATDFPFSLGVPTPTIDDPQAVLAAHVGQGTLFIQWTHPTPDLVRVYEIYGSMTDGGPYTKLQHGESFITRAMLHNIPMASQVYLQIRAIGINGAISNFVGARQGKFQNPSVRCSVRAISGSTIPEGALFVHRDENTGRLIGLRAESDITITC